jgi:hypothetical protein
MSTGTTKGGLHTFSIVLQSKDGLKRITIPSEGDEEVIIEGNLGELRELDLVENAMLEIKGIKGILRIEVSEGELIALRARARASL